MQDRKSIDDREKMTELERIRHSCAHVMATAMLRLSEGCSHPCSFCVIPKLRGGLQSRPEELILREARVLAGLS